MKPIRQLLFVALACASALLLCVSLACTAQDTPQDQPSAAEENAYQAAHNEKEAQAKIKLLDDFVAAHPGSSLLRDAYRDEYMTLSRLATTPRPPTTSISPGLRGKERSGRSAGSLDHEGRVFSRGLRRCRLPNAAILYSRKRDRRTGAGRTRPTSEPA